MSLLGDLLSAPLKIVNAPIRAAENLMLDGKHTREGDRFLSKPLDAVSDEIKKI